MTSAFSPEQIARYLHHINLPLEYHPSANPALDLDFLTVLHVHQLSTIPYENLLLHYSTAHRVSLDPQVLLEKVLGNGRGGYCMENSIFYNHVLRALGFDVYTTGVRIRMRDNGVPKGDYIGWTHIVNIVTLSSGTSYMVDVGFGGDGATLPVPLIDGLEHHNLGTQDIRLIRSHIPPQRRPSLGPLWIYQYRNGGPPQDWNSFYAFSESEWFEADFKIINWYTSTSPDSFQTHTPLVVKFLRRENGSVAGGQEIYGKVMLAKEVVKRNLGGKTEVVLVCGTDAERVRALREWFGIRLTEEEVMGIRGMRTELPWE